jgi:hypothetical protein
MRQNYSFKNSVEFINELIESERINSLYLVVNDVKKSSSYRYGLWLSAMVTATAMVMLTEAAKKERKEGQRKCN